MVSKETTESIQNLQEAAYENDDFEKDDLVNVESVVGRSKKGPTKMEQKPLLDQK